MALSLSSYFWVSDSLSSVEESSNDPHIWYHWNSLTDMKGLGQMSPRCLIVSENELSKTRLTHWPLEDAPVILIMIFKLIHVSRIIDIYSIPCEIAPRWMLQGLLHVLVSIGSGNGLVLLGSKPLPESCWPSSMMPHGITRPQWVNTLRQKEDGRHFADDIFTCIFFNENCSILLKFSLKYVRKGPIDNNPPLVQIMAWRRSGADIIWTNDD